MVIRSSAAGLFGDGATIATGAVVTKDVAPYAVVAGNSAAFRKWRSGAKLCEKMKWWDWPLERIAEAVPYLQSDDVDGLFHLYEG